MPVKWNKTGILNVKEEGEPGASTLVPGKGKSKKGSKKGVEKAKKEKKKKKVLSPEELESIANPPEAPKEDYSRGTPEEIEYRRKQVLRLTLRGVPQRTIAEHLKVSLGTINNDIRMNNEGIRSEVENLDVPLFVGQTLSFYDEVRNIALRMATDKNEKDKRILLGALREATNAETAKHNFLQTVGFYKVPTMELMLRRILEGTASQVDDAADFANFMKMFEGDDNPAIELLPAPTGEAS